MAGSLNRVMLIGNVGKDPEIRHTQDGKAIANFTLATSDVWRDKGSGERKERTEWHRVVCFNDNLTKVIQSYVTKGSKIFVSGSLQTRKWTDQSGVEKYSTEVVLQAFNGELVLLDGKPDRDTGSGYPEVGSERDPQKPWSPPAARDLDDEVPF